MRLAKENINTMMEKGRWKMDDGKHTFHGFKN